MGVVGNRLGLSLVAWSGNCGYVMAVLLIATPFVARSQSPIEKEDSGLQCLFTPIQPTPDFALRFRTGYEISLPLSQFRGAKLSGKTKLEVTPDCGIPLYLSDSFALADVPQTGGYAQLAGAFVVGEGGYTVNAVVEDDLHRICRSQWRIRAEGNDMARQSRLPVAPLTVGDEWPAPPGRLTRRLKLGQLTILLHAAPLLTNADKLRGSDVSMLIGSLSSLLQRLPARTVRLVVFNLEQHAVLFRQDGFVAADLRSVEKTINELQLSCVKYATLQRHDGAVDLLQNLTHEEFKKLKPNDALVFLGPHTRVHDPIPADAVRGFQRGPRVFYVEHQPQLALLRDDDPTHAAAIGRLTCDAYSPGICPKTGDLDRPWPNDWRDSIERLVGRLKGETLAVRQPSDLVRAIRRIATRFSLEGQMPSGPMAAKQ